MDIHASSQRFSDDNAARLEILEAGTGHGSLTLHLARAIHAINAPTLSGQSSPDQRKAVIHTVDASEKYSEHAKKIVHGFRQGLYTKDVVFYAASVSDWLNQQLRARQVEESDDKTFLHHVILDMPDSYREVEKASSALRADGSLLLFNPSITQITAAVELVKAKRLPLFLEQVVELGRNLTGGKEWDVRAVKPRAILQAEQEKKLAREEAFVNSERHEHDQTSVPNTSVDELSRDSKQYQAAMFRAEGFHMICRPKGFVRLLGGGFLGVWRKKLPALKPKV